MDCYVLKVHSQFVIANQRQIAASSGSVLITQSCTQYQASSLASDWAPCCLYRVAAQLWGSGMVYNQKCTKHTEAGVQIDNVNIHVMKHIAWMHTHNCRQCGKYK